MSAVTGDAVVQETWAMFQVSVEGSEGLEIEILPGSIPSKGTSKTMFLVTNRHRRKVVDLSAEAKLLEEAPKVRLGAVKFHQPALSPGEVSFGTIEIATEGAAPGDHGIGLAVSYRLAPHKVMRAGSPVRGKPRISTARARALAGAPPP